MSVLTKILAGIVTAATLAMQLPVVQVAVTGFMTAHPGVSAVLAGVSAILALLHQPTAQDGPTPKPQVSK